MTIKKVIESSNLSNKYFDFTNTANSIEYKFQYTIAKLRAETNLPDVVFISDNTLQGVFQYDNTDTTSADNNNDILVSGTKRYKRVNPIGYLPLTGGTLTGVLRLLENLGMNNGQYIYFKNSTGIDLRVLGVGGENIYLGDSQNQFNGSVVYYSKNNHIFYVNGVEKARLNQDGNFGIGTTTPSEQLEISNSISGGTGGRLLITNSANQANGNISDIGFKVNSNFTSGYFSAMIRAFQQNSSNNSDLAFYTYDGTASTMGTEKMRILANGNVGIGTSTPLATLDVNGTVKNKFTSVNANYTLGDDYYVVVTANSPTITLPTASGMQGLTYYVKNTGTGIVTVNSVSGLVEGVATKTILTGVSYQFVSDGTNWLIF